MNHRAFNRNFTCQGSPFLALSLLALIGALLLMNWSVIHRWDIWQNASSAVTRLPVLSSHYCSLTCSQRFWLGGIANSIFFFFFNLYSSTETDCISTHFSEYLYILARPIRKQFYCEFLNLWRILWLL